jgi:hypothetical protein
MRNPNKNQEMALVKARSWAKQGNSTQAQYWINRAGAFASVSQGQLAYIQRLLRKAQQ